MILKKVPVRVGIQLKLLTLMKACMSDNCWTVGKMSEIMGNK